MQIVILSEKIFNEIGTFYNNIVSLILFVTLSLLNIYENLKAYNFGKTKNKLWAVEAY